MHDKPTTFRAQDVKHDRRVCRTSDEINEAVAWQEELKAEGRFLGGNVLTTRGLPPVVMTDYF